MSKRPLPSVFQYLVEEPNLAVDAALADALPEIEPFAQSAALETLIRRGDAPSLSVVASRFEQYEGALSKLAAARASDLAAGVRTALSLPGLEQRRSAIALIVYGEAADLAYLLVEALRHSSRETRLHAALALRRMTATLLKRLAEASSPVNRAALVGKIDRLAEALGSAVRYWEIHHQREVLEAALWLGQRTERAVAKKLAEPKSRLSRVLSGMLEGGSDPKLAGYTLRGLAHPSLRGAAVGAITQSQDSDFLRAVVRECWLLGDPSIASGCRRLQPGVWVNRVVALLPTLDDQDVARLVQLVWATGGTTEPKVAAIQQLLDSPSVVVDRSVVWTLTQDQREFATELLRIMASRGSSSVAKIAEREVRRRQRRSGAGLSTFDQVASEETLKTPVHAAFERCWRGAEPAEDGDRNRSEEILRRHREEALPLLRVQLASPEPLDRAQALRAAARLGWLEELEPIVQRLAHDGHALVRGAAISALGDLPGATSERILRAALDDPDERVQADAVEALDRLDLPDRVAWTKPKLDSLSSRVRANAAKSLLRTDLDSAAETLVQMLEHEDVSFRLSALWVIEHLRSRAVVDRLVRLSEHDTDSRVRKRATRTLNMLENVPGVGSTAVAHDAHRISTGDGS